MPKSHITPTRSEILAKAADGTLLDALFDEYGRYWFNDDDPTIAVLASVHNDGDVDLLALVTPQSLERHKGHNFFQGQHVYQALISRLDASAEALMQAVEVLRVGAGQDMAAGLPIDQFAKWCGADPGRPAELLGLIDAGVANADRYLTIAIKNGVEVDAPYFTDRAYQFLETGTETERLGAINALGQIALADASGWDRLAVAFEGVLSPDPGDIVRSVVLTAMSRRLKGAPSTHVAALEAIALATIAPMGEHTLYEAARVLAFDFDALGSALVAALLDTLLAVDPEHKGTVDCLDLALMKLVEAGHPEMARSFLEQVLARDEKPLRLKQFDSLRHKLFEIGGTVLEDWVVAWLRKGESRLCSEMNNALFGAGTDEHVLVIDFTRFAPSDTEYPYLARKAIATFFLKPVLMASILTSLLRSAPKDAADEIEALLIDPILINYSGVASEHLKPIADDPTDVAAPAAARALAGLEAYIDGLKSIGTVPELHPSERERQLEWQRHSDSMTQAMRAARKKSIFAQIVTESVMLYGNRAVSWVEFPAEKPRRIETELASIGTTIEIPRVDTVDPLGLQLMLLTFRSEGPPA